MVKGMVMMASAQMEMLAVNLRMRQLEARLGRMRSRKRRECPRLNGTPDSHAMLKWKIIAERTGHPGAGAASAHRRAAWHPHTRPREALTMGCP